MSFGEFCLKHRKIFFGCILVFNIFIFAYSIYNAVIFWSNFTSIKEDIFEMNEDNTEPLVVKQKHTIVRQVMIFCGTIMSASFLIGASNICALIEMIQAMNQREKFGTTLKSLLRPLEVTCPRCLKIGYDRRKQED